MFRKESVCVLREASIPEMSITHKMRLPKPCKRVKSVTCAISYRNVILYFQGRGLTMVQKVSFLQIQRIWRRNNWNSRANPDFSGYSADGSAPGLGPGGRGFDPRCSDHCVARRRHQEELPLRWVVQATAKAGKCLKNMPY